MNAPGPPPHAAHATAEDQRRLASALMRRQARLSASIAIVFLALLLGLPLLNRFAPGVAMAKIGGIPVTWLLLAVAFYPMTWLLSWIFIKGSDKMEADCARMARKVLDNEAPATARDGDASR